MWAFSICFFSRAYPCKFLKGLAKPGMVFHALPMSNGVGLRGMMCTTIYVVDEQLSDSTCNFVPPMHGLICFYITLLSQKRRALEGDVDEATGL